MKNNLTVKNLMASHFDNGDHILEFDVDGEKVFLTVHGLGPVDDEFYWDDEENLQKAVEEAQEAVGMVKVNQEMQELVGAKWKTYEVSESTISIERFINSFVDEEWSTEKRFGKMATPKGVYHNKTVVYSPSGDIRSVRHFEYVG